MPYVEFKLVTCGIDLDSNAPTTPQRAELKSSDLRGAVVEPIAGQNYLGKPFGEAIVVTSADTGSRIALLPGQYKPADIEALRAKATILSHDAA